MMSTKFGNASTKHKQVHSFGQQIRSLVSILRWGSRAVRSTGFSRQDIIPPKGGTTNTLKQLVQNPIALRTCITLLLFAIPSNLLANDVELKATVDRDKVQIADPFELEIRLLAPQGTQVSFPALAETLGPFEILNRQERSDVPVSDGPEPKRLWSRSLTLETIVTGQLEIPSVEIKVRESGQSEKTLRTRAITINVGSVIEPATDLTQFKGIADLHNVELPAKPYPWIWIASGAGAVALVTGCMMLLTRKRKPVPSSVWALQRLSETSELSQAELIVRQFIEERFEFAATSLPSDQIIAELRQNKVHEVVRSDLQELLQLAEKAKFGGLDIASTEEARLVNRASKLVRQLNETKEAEL